VITNWNCCFCL